MAPIVSATSRAARRDGAGHRADTVVERIDDLLTALGQPRVELGDAGGEALLELREAGVDRTGDLAGVAGDALIESVDVIAHRLGDVLGALTEPFHQFAAIGLHGAVELGDVAGDQAAERRGVARDLLAERGAAVVEHVLEGLQARAQHGLDLVAAVGEHMRQAFGVLAEGIGHRVAALDHGVGNARAGLLQLGDHVAAAQAQIEHQRVAGRTQRRIHFLGAGGDGFGHLTAGLREGVVELLRAARHGFDGDGGLLREALRDLVEPGGHHLLQADAEVGEIVVDMVGLEIEAGGQPFAGRTDSGGGAVAGGLQTVEHGRAALGQGVDHAVADVAQGQRDVLALLGERTGDALRHFADLVGDQVADRGDVVRQIEVDAGDGVAHVLGLVDQSLALVGELAEQIADAHFVVVVGALERGDFVVHQRFQLGGAGERALDAVAHGGDFAADGVADGHDLLARGGLRLGQPHRHLGHGLGDQAQVLRAAQHVGDRVEENHRHDDGGDEPDNDGDGAARGGEQCLQFAAIEESGGKRAGGPENGGGAGHDIGHAGGPALRRLQHLAEARRGRRWRRGAAAPRRIPRWSAAALR